MIFQKHMTFRFTKTLLFIIASVLLVTALPKTNALAQVYSSVSVEIGENIEVLNIGQQAYLSENVDSSVTHNEILKRHNSNLRGTLQTNDLLNLGLEAHNSWMLFSIINNTNKENWVFNFGKPLEGRHAFAKNILLHNQTLQETFVNTLSPEVSKLPHIPTLYGPYVPIKLAPFKTNILLVYFEPEGPISNTLKPKILSYDYYLDMVQSGDYELVIVGFLFMFAIIFFATAAYIIRNFSYAWLSAFYLLHMILFFILKNNFYTDFYFMSECFALLSLSTLALALLNTWYFLQLQDTHNQQRIVFWLASALLLVCSFASLITLSTNSVWAYYFLCLPFIGVSGIIIALSITQSIEGKFGAPHYTLGWVISFLALIISVLTASGFIYTSSLTINAYWLGLLGQMLFFILAISRKIKMQSEEKRHVRARKSREEQSLYRLKQSKESADQARLLRIIEREREVMSELRERERQRTEDMRKSKVSADEANRAKSAFLAVVSHEVRTPMTGIMGMVRLLLDTKLSKSQQDYAVAIQKSGDTMMALLNDILDFEKIETGNMALEIINFDLPKLVNGVVTLMTGHANEKGIILKSDIGGDVPNYVQGDPTRLRQVILNLVNNAIKFTDEGQVVVRIENKPFTKNLPENENKHAIYIAVEDTGIGISLEAQAKLFSPFEQAEASTTRRYGGTGLGLTICKKLVEAMNGAINVHSKVNEGSTFSFSIIMEQGVAELTEENMRSEQQKDRKYNTPPMKILVIEDNEMNRRVLNGLIEKYGHKVVMSDSGENGLDKILEQSFDLILTDIQLNGMTGIEVATALRDLPQSEKAKTPIIALTGNVRPNDIQSYYDVNINGFLAKPIDPQKLAETIYKAYHNDFENPVKLNQSRQSATHDKLSSPEKTSLQPNSSLKSLGTIDTANQALGQSQDQDQGQGKSNTTNKISTRLEVSALQKYINEQQSPSNAQNATPKTTAPETIKINAAPASSNNNSADHTPEFEDTFETAINSIPSTPPPSSAQTPSSPELSIPAQNTARDSMSEHRPALNKELSGDTQHSSKTAKTQAPEDLYDTAVLMDLISSLGMDQTLPLLEDYFEFAAKIIEALEQLKNTDQHDEIYARAHELKGMAANFGIKKISDISANIEKASKVKDDESTMTLIQSLRDSHKQTEDNLQSFLDNQV